MLWYGGSIAEAVNLSKQKNAIFVVFVEGDNDLSAEMTATIEHADVARRLADDKRFLAIKLTSGSQNYTHFAQIYQFVPVPSLFFIGRNGTPLEVVCAGVQPEMLATRIDRIVEEHYQLKPSTVEPSSSGLNIRDQTQSLLDSESKPKASDTSTEPKPGAPSSSQVEPKKLDSDTEPTISEASPVGPTAPKVPKTDDKDYEVVCFGDVCLRRPKQVPGSSEVPRTPDEPSREQLVQEASPPEEPSADVEDRLERAKVLIEQKRIEKEKKEKELERQKELERRSTGQGVVELRRWQEDQELKQIQEGHKREKMEDNLARQRILAQIAQDRAERRAREAPLAPLAPAPAPAAAPSAPPSGDGSQTARVQFKMPDGTSHAATFQATDTLQDVTDYVAANVQAARGGFSLWTAFPRRQLGPDSAAASLRALGLAPSAALLVLPASAASPASASAAPRAASPAAAAAPRPPLAAPATLSRLYEFVAGLLAGLVGPLNDIWEWVSLRILGGGTPPGPRAGAASPRRGAPPPPPAPPAPPAGPPTPPDSLRRRAPSNVHRLSTDPQPDDDNNTWNGNSTQQM